ncbi:MAG: hypothetical protein IPO09_14340 [Anaeromyxobacter sp.]|nr:hypothetical protein [Anaeromyxobacter sp.]MBL0275364.1 hypothetical protein [Anaeromyxobacter sp.]
MNPGFAFALLLGLLAGDPLAPAREAFARLDHEAAATLALAEARPPRQGAALDLAGLARFRAGRSAEALAAFDAAGRAEDAPPRGRWQYNRGACLYDLGRAAEAEQAFLEAATLDEALAPAALANAGFAALDAGSPSRARALLQGLRSLPGLSEPVRRLAEELDAALPAASPLPSQPVVVGVVGVVGAPAVAGDGSAPPPLPAPEPLRAPTLSLLAGVGYDSNVLQSGLGTAPEGAPIASGRVQGATLSLAGAAQRRWTPAPGTTLWLGYGLDQLAYPSATAEDYSLQQHQLTVGVERQLGAWRLALWADGYAAFTGLSSFRGLQAGGGLGGSASRAWSAASSTRLDIGWGGRLALSGEFEHLDGDRLDLALGQAHQLGPLLLGASLRWRRERLGVLEQATQQNLPCPVGHTCSQRYEIPYGSDGLQLAASAQLELGDRLWPGQAKDRLALGLLLGWEGRRYDGPSLLRRQETDALGGVTSAVVAPRLRLDDLAFLGATARLKLGAHLWLAVRYDLSLNWSTVARTGRPGPTCLPSSPGCHALDYDDKNYTRHAGGLEATLAW